MNKGSYILILKLEREVEILRPKKTVLRPGYYVYVGSAMNSLTGRVKRHLSKSKKIHWHIDQLTVQSKIIGVYMFVGLKIEETLSEFFSRYLENIDGFGSSDLRTSSNLFYSSSVHQVIKIIEQFYKERQNLV
ncbi:MAG: DUF123 domain-containing protein [Thermotogaceae bacterium]|nr:DUF123 domain-containing protein [Thermotogaceae bacterium]